MGFFESIGDTIANITGTGGVKSVGTDTTDQKNLSKKASETSSKFEEKLMSELDKGGPASVKDISGPKTSAAQTLGAQPDMAKSSVVGRDAANAVLANQASGNAGGFQNETARNISTLQQQQATGNAQTTQNINALSGQNMLAGQAAGMNSPNQQAQATGVNLALQAAQGNAPSAAQLQFAQNQQANIAAQKALTSGQAYNPLAQRNIANQAAAQNQQLAAQTGILRAQEMATGLNQLGQQSASAVGLQQQAQQAAASNANAQLGLLQNAQQNAASTANTQLGLLQNAQGQSAQSAATASGQDIQRDLQSRQQALMAQGMDADQAFRVAQANQQKDLQMNSQNLSFEQMLMQGQLGNQSAAQQGYAGIAGLEQQANINEQAQREANTGKLMGTISKIGEGVANIYTGGGFSAAKGLMSASGGAGGQAKGVSQVDELGGR